ncbi:MAG: hypothetical protein R3F56_07315 [Planctomycetota bacterium]
MRPQRVITGYVRRARWRGALGGGLVSLAAVALLVAGLWALVARFDVAAAAVILRVGSVLGIVWVIALAARARISVAALDAEVQLGDALTTYWPRRGGDNAAGMAGWLETSLAARLAASPPPLAASRAVRRTLRCLLPLLPFLLLLLLLLWLLPAGLGSGARRGVEGAPGEQQGGSGGGEGPDGAPAGGQPQPNASAPPPSSPPVPDSPSAEQDRDATAGASARALALPVREEFVVPSFVGDGPSLPGKARQAEQEVAPVAPLPPAAGSGRGGQTPPLPEADFAHAAERAAAARHVPPAERPIVQRYFEALAERR